MILDHIRHARKHPQVDNIVTQSQAASEGATEHRTPNLRNVHPGPPHGCELIGNGLRTGGAEVLAVGVLELCLVHELVQPRDLRASGTATSAGWAHIL